MQRRIGGIAMLSLNDNDCQLIRCDKASGTARRHPSLTDDVQHKDWKPTTY